MRITEITVRNFRSFDDNGVHLELPSMQCPISLIGHNNSGKTNFLKALVYGLAVKNVNDDTFTLDDYHLRDGTREILIEIRVDPPLKSADIYNNIKEMPILHLHATIEHGVGEVRHVCCGADGKPIFNARALKRGANRKFTQEERDLLNENLRKGSEMVSRLRSKIPVYYIDCSNMEWQLKPKSYTLLGKVLAHIRQEFELNSSIMPDQDGVIDAHKGQPRKAIFERALKYLDDHVLPTKSFTDLVGLIERVLREQLELESDGFSIHFGQPSSDYFFDNLQFFVTDNSDKPRLPITHMGNGFVSLFVVALIRAIVRDDEGGNIFLLEEPETFQHEHFQEYFYRVLCELAEKNQVIYATHSKKFVDVFAPDSIVHFSNPRYLESRVTYRTPQTVDYPKVVDGLQLRSPEDFAKYMRTLEPNIGNIAFASKVVIVEGPHDLMAYRTVVENEINIGLHNIAIVAAWGKDSLVTIVQLCKKLRIPYFVIHDFDLADPAIDISQAPGEANATYNGLSRDDKGQFTKNHKIATEAGLDKLHHNKRNLEAVLDIPAGEKSTVSVFARLNGKSVADVVSEYPLFFPQRLADFLGIPIGADTPVESTTEG